MATALMSAWKLEPLPEAITRMRQGGCCWYAILVVFIASQVWQARGGEVKIFRRNWLLRAVAVKKKGDCTERGKSNVEAEKSRSAAIPRTSLFFSGGHWLTTGDWLGRVEWVNPSDGLRGVFRTGTKSLHSQDIESCWTWNIVLPMPKV